MQELEKSARVRWEEFSKALGNVSRTYANAMQKKGIYPVRIRESSRMAFWWRAELESFLAGENWLDAMPGTPQEKTWDARNIYENQLSKHGRS